LRGAVAVGPALFSKRASTFLGVPLVDAVRMEEKQDWLGVTFCDEFLRPPYNHVYPDLVIPYSDQFKCELDRKNVHIALNWTRRWQATQHADIETAIAEMNTDSNHAWKYENTIRFFQFCEEYRDWYKDRSDLSKFPPAMKTE